jgi:hypothetical protein
MGGGRKHGRRMDTRTVIPEVAAAAVTGAFLVLVALIERTRRENNRDHGQNAVKLDRIEDKIDGHINDHARRDLG